MKYIILLSIFLSINSFACVCVDLPDFEENLKSYDLIAFVELKEYKTLFGNKKYRLNPIKGIKGSNMPKFNSISQGITSCDAELKDGDIWLVFTTPNAGDISLGGCSPNLPLEHLKLRYSEWLKSNKP
ncbi:MAG: hypothetical protein EOP48_20650 [Sphingobacteriales bacterium]|jgi:hypothetical protein|nr:MAG: hypothetical protein EOP48_20650 [Sphingobacteriales bacterium]